MTTYNWQVGDRARIVSVDDEDIAQGLKVGDIVTIQGNYDYGVKLLGCSIHNAELWGLYIGQIEPLRATPEEIAEYKAKHEGKQTFTRTPPGTKTYTLTPYIKPETVTINGVEYIMTENV